MADFLDAKVREIEERLQELRPLIEEFHRLEAAAAALDDVDATGAAAAAPPAAQRHGRRGRPRGSRGDNTRATQTVELVRAEPGITIPELAEHMGIKPNYLYRVLPQLADEGKVRARGQGLAPGLTACADAVEGRGPPPVARPGTQRAPRDAFAARGAAAAPCSPRPARAARPRRAPRAAPRPSRRSAPARSR